jgi:hypothetical protein
MLVKQLVKGGLLGMSWPIDGGRLGNEQQDGFGRSGQRAVVRDGDIEASTHGLVIEQKVPPHSRKTKKITVCLLDATQEQTAVVRDYSKPHSVQINPMQGVALEIQIESRTRIKLDKPDDRPRSRARRSAALRFGR